MHPEALARRTTVASRILGEVSRGVAAAEASERDTSRIEVSLALSDVLEILGAYLGSEQRVDSPSQEADAESEGSPPHDAPRPEPRKVEPLLGTRFARVSDEDMD